MTTLTTDYIYSPIEETFLMNESPQSINTYIGIKNPITDISRLFKLIRFKDGFFHYSSFDGTRSPRHLKMKIKAEVEKYQSLVGKTLCAYGWHYDNGGTCNGVISKVEMGDDAVIHIEESSRVSNSDMLSFTFSFSEIEKLYSEGVLPEANRMLNTGRNASVK